MTPASLTFCYVAAGMTLGVGMLNLLAGFQKGGAKVYRFFGLISSLTGLFFLFFPGFFDPEVSPFYTKTVTSLLIAYYVLFPFFVSAYTGYKNRWLLVAVTFWSVGVIYPLMLFGGRGEGWSLWGKLGHISIIGIVVYGFLGAFHLLKRGERRSGRIFLSAMALFALLSFEEMSRVYLGWDLFNLKTDIWISYPIEVYNPFGSLNPLDLFPLLFITVIAISLANDQARQFKLERQLRLRERKWSKLLSNIKLLLVQWDEQGKVDYVNPFFQEVTRLNRTEIGQQDWFRALMLQESARQGAAQQESLIQDLPIKDSQPLMVHWSVVNLKDAEEGTKQSLAIGRDITARQQAFEEIQRLKEQLEKENDSLNGALGEIESLKAQLEKENLKLRRELNRYAEGTDGQIVGTSPPLVYAISRSVQVAPTLASVLLEGETGVGKELFAALIHRKSERVDQPYVKVNCATLPHDLIESELFGHEKGAFTGAVQSRKGRFEMADGGTLFLDEIGELPLDLQPKLLRVLQSGEFERIGGQKTLQVDVRVISATNRNLEQMIQEGKFREDLFYRLNVYPITIPPLRDRKEDIPLLVDHFVEKLSKRNHKDFSSVSRGDLAKLTDYDWPGNIRELENVIERAVIMSQGDTLRLEVASQELELLPGNGKSNGITLSLEEVERNHIIKVLEQCGWKINGQAGAAEVLQLNPNTLRSRMKKLNIHRPG